MNPAILAVAEASPERYHYSQEVSPNEVFWLALGLPVQPIGSSSMLFLRVNIADTMIFGFGHESIYLKTDSSGCVSRQPNSLEAALSNIPDDEEINVAYEKETFLKPIPRGDIFTFEGNYVTSLRRKHYQGVISQTFQRMAHDQRQFRIQRHVTIRHHKVHKYAYNRVIYKLNDKTTVLAIHSIEDAVISRAEIEREKTSREKPWLQQPKSSQGRRDYRKASYDSIRQKQKITKPAGSDSGRARNGGGDMLLMFSDDAAQDTAKAKTDTKRELQTFDPNEVVVREVAATAAAELIKNTKNVAAHLALVFHKQVAALTLDFVKDVEGKYVLTEVCGFEFTDHEVGSHRVMRLCSRVKSLLESFYRFRFGGKDEDELEALSSDSKFVMEKHVAPETADHLDIRTPQTVLCRLCKCRINNHDTRYCMTSVMIQSTVMHMRARLSPADWPEFCKDRSYTMKSMQRADDALSSKSLPRVDATEVNMYVCELCYSIYKQETRLIEVERKLALFTRSHVDEQPVKSPEEVEPPAQVEAPPPIMPARRTSMNSWARPSTAPNLGSSPLVLTSATAPLTPKTPTVKPKSPSSSASGKGSLTLSHMPRASEVAKESAIRDLFRAKNAPSRLPSKDYFEINFSSVTKSPTKSDKSESKKPEDAQEEKSATQEKKKMKKVKVDNRPVYPKPTIMPMGRRIARSEMMALDLTMCRMMIAIQKVSDLPVIFFDAYEGFSLCYYVLGQRTDIPCKKSMIFSRQRTNRFVNADAHRAMAVGAISEGEEESSDDSSTNSGSSDGSSVCSTSTSNSDSTAQDESASLSRSSDGGGYAMTRRASKMVMQAENAAVARGVARTPSQESDLCVGALDAKFLKMTHFMVPGNCSVDGLPAYNDFLSDTGRIMVVLCGKLKQNAMIDERHWIIPDMSETRDAKAAKLRKDLIDLKAEYRKKSGGSTAYNHLSHLSRGSRRAKIVAALDYDPRADTRKVTDIGDPLPEDAIAYSYLPLDQFTSTAVKRLDLGTPMTYAIRHLPKERSVPMLRAMVGIDRPVYPMDNWSLPFSMVLLEKEGGVYVPEVSDQYCAPTPLPKEWLNIELERNAHRRVGVGATNQMADPGANLAAQLTTMAQSQTTIDIDGKKRTAPALHVSAGRIERITMVVQRTPQKVEEKVDTEQRLERMECSVWCLCIQVMSARHVCTSDEIFSEEKPFWKCKYNFFGDEVAATGALKTDDIEDGVVTFGYLSKHMFRGSVDALEAMFADMDPVQFSVQRADPPEDYLASQRLSASASGNPSILRINTKEMRTLNTMADCDKKCHGHLELTDMHQNRFSEVTVQMMRDDAVLSRRDKMYPPYLSVNLKLFRMGPREEGVWLPQQTRLGEEIFRYVNKVVPLDVHKDDH